jgi:hypothetical protein
VPLQERIDHPVLGHFSHKTNIYNMADVIREDFGGDSGGRTGHKRYGQDNLTPLERRKLARDLQSHLPANRRLGEPLKDDDDDDDGPRVRGYVDVAESHLAAASRPRFESVRTAIV